MKDGKVRDIVDIRFALDFKYDVDEIEEACESLVEEKVLNVVEEGELLKKYKFRSE